MPHIPTRPLLCGRFFTSQSIASYVSVASSTSVLPLYCHFTGRTSSNFPSDMYRPRTSWYTKMNLSRSNVGLGPSDVLYASPYGATPYGVRGRMIGELSERARGG